MGLLYKFFHWFLKSCLQCYLMLYMLLAIEHELDVGGSLVTW